MEYKDLEDINENSEIFLEEILNHMCESFDFKKEIDNNDYTIESDIVKVKKQDIKKYYLDIKNYLLYSITLKLDKYLSIKPEDQDGFISFQVKTK